MSYEDVQRRIGESVKYTLTLPVEDASVIQDVASKRRCKPQAIIRELVGKAIDAGLAV